MASSFKSELQLPAPATTSPSSLSPAAANSPQFRESVAMTGIKFYQRRHKEMKKEKEQLDDAQKNWVPETPVKPVPARPQNVYTKRRLKGNSGPSFLSRISKEAAEAEADHDMTVIMSSVGEKEEKEEKEDKARSLNFSCLSSSSEVSIDLNISICDMEDAGISVCGSKVDGGSGNSLLESGIFNLGGGDICTFNKESNEGLVDRDVQMDNLSHSSELLSYPSVAPPGECAIDRSPDASFRGLDITPEHLITNFLPEIHNLSDSLPLQNESNNRESHATECDREKDSQGDCTLKELHSVQQLEPATPLRKHNKRPSSGRDTNPRPAKKSKIKRKRHRPKVAVDGVPRRPVKILSAKKEKMVRVRKTQPRGKKEKKNQSVKRLKTSSDKTSTIENHAEIVVADSSLSSVLSQTNDEKIVGFLQSSVESGPGTADTGDQGSEEKMLLTIPELPSIHSTQDNVTPMSESHLETKSTTKSDEGENIPSVKTNVGCRYTLRIRHPEKELGCECMDSCGHKKASKVILCELSFPKLCKRTRMKRKRRPKMSIILNFFLLKSHIKKKRSEKKRLKRTNFTYHGPENCEDLQLDLLEETLTGETKGMEEESVLNPSKQFPIGEEQGEVNYEGIGVKSCSNNLLQLQPAFTCEGIGVKSCSNNLLQCQLQPAFTYEGVGVKSCSNNLLLFQLQPAFTSEQQEIQRVTENCFEMRPLPAYPELQEESLYKQNWLQLIDKSIGTQKVFNHEDIIMKKEELCIRRTHSVAGEFLLPRIGETGAVAPYQDSLSTKASRSRKTGGRVCHQGFLSPKNGAIVPYPGSLSIKEGAIVPHQGSPSPEKGALVPHQGFLSRKKGAVVLYQGPLSAKKFKPRIDIDPETMRRWLQIKRKEDGLGEEEEEVDEKTKRKWEEDRKIFEGRLGVFTKKMHMALGNRKFKPWKGSVVDSVVGVFLTQNVSDILSSSAYMALAAKFPNKTHNQEEFHCSQESTGSTNSPGPQYFVTTYDEEGLVDIEDIGKPILSRTSYRNENISLRDWNPETTSRGMEIINPLPSSENLNGIETSSRMNPPNFHEFYQTCCSSSGACHGSDSSEITGDYRAEIVVQKSLPDAFALPQDCYPQAEVRTEKNLGSECCSQAEAGTEKSMDFLDMQHDEKLKEVVPDGATDDASSMDPASKEARTTTTGKKNVDKKKEVQKKDWDELRRKYSRLRSSDHTDTVDWEAVRQADVNVIAEIIKARGQHTIIAARIKGFLDRVVELHGSIDLEWLRYTPPMVVKAYLLDVQGLGLKSVECTRLLELGHVAFPVDVNVSRISVRLGWVPLKPLPGGLQFHLLEEYPIMDTVQEYLWPRLREFSSLTLYEFHYHLITFGKIFCKKRSPNCNACPMRPECRHYASAVAASTNLNLPGPTNKDTETSIVPSIPVIDSHPFSDNVEVANPKISVTLLESGVTSEPGLETFDCVPSIEEPKSPELVQYIEDSGLTSEPVLETSGCVPSIEEPKSPELVQNIKDSGEREDDCDDDDVDDNKLIDNEEEEEEEEEIPTIILNNEEFRKNVQYYLEKNSSRALVPLSVDVNLCSAPKLKRTKHLRTEHEVYEVPDGHEILRGLERRDPEDSVPYLLAIWTAGETPNSVEQPKKKCNSQGSELCTDETCFACQSICEGEADIVRGTILIPCRTAMRARFPLNGTYFQVNEVFADHETSCEPLIVPRKLIWHLKRRTVFFGTSASAIFTSGCSLLDIQRNFWRGFTCMRGFDRKTRGPEPLARRFHCSPSKMEKTPKKVNPNKKKTTPKEKGNASKSKGTAAV